MCVHAHHVCVSSRRESIVVSCQRREAAAAAIAIQRKQKSEIIVPISSSLNPMLPFGCHAVAIVRKHPPAPEAFPSLALRQKRFRIPKAKDNKHVRACLSRELSAGASTHNRLERRHRTGFLSGGWKEKGGKERKTHKLSPARICCCDLLWVSRPWAKVGGSESRYQVGRARKSECRLGLVVPLEQGR